MAREQSWADLLRRAESYTPSKDSTFARGRLTGFTYLSASFDFNRPGSADHGKPARFVSKVIDSDYAAEPLVTDPDTATTEEETTLTSSSRTRTQITALVVRDTGRVRQIQIHKVPMGSNADDLEPLVTLRDAEAQTLMDYIATLANVPATGDVSARIDDQALAAVFTDPTAFARAYADHRAEFRALIEQDVSAADVVAISARKAAVAEFARLLSDVAYFDKAAESANGPESVWQNFLEENPWILGANLSGQLLTGWSAEKLEQVVTGKSIASVGKRADALLRTKGGIRSMVFAEIKHHRTPLLKPGDPYRSGSFAPSDELSGGVAQTQQEVYRAVQHIGPYLADEDDEGYTIPGEGTFLHRPRSFLVIGTLDQLKKDNAVHEDKYQCFELYRRNLYEPEVITFDELLARAQWQVALAEQDDRTQGESTGEDLI